jgi:hypothetical protein
MATSTHADEARSEPEVNDVSPERERSGGLTATTTDGRRSEYKTKTIDHDCQVKQIQKWWNETLRVRFGSSCYARDVPLVGRGYECGEPLGSNELISYHNCLVTKPQEFRCNGPREDSLPRDREQHPTATSSAACVDITGEPQRNPSSFTHFPLYSFHMHTKTKREQKKIFFLRKESWQHRL